ncbi:MAG: hypothetical protein IT289_05045 [Oligoflexia bacterium]|nr:hypothetical protein [Oligoflexia bacterium]
MTNIKGNLFGRTGQVVLEYVLLLAVALVAGTLVMRGCVGTSEEPAGIRQEWGGLLRAIGTDLPDRE